MKNRRDGALPASMARRHALAVPAAGFTLIELMVTLTVAAILVGLAIPSFTTFIQNTHLSGEAESLLYSLNYARSEAIKENAAVNVCASSDGMTCNGASWAQGWIVQNASPTPLSVVPALVGSNTLSASDGSTTLTFMGTGQVLNAVQFVFCDSRGASYGREVEVDTLGRAAAAQTAGQTVSGLAIGGC